ncbi:MAG: esterase-like activity of phytase family protein [Synechococcales cyanobacterium C42_A2020_086]|jgi:hypothetical protein|nr:esterase-like activity of phytase family protein [Synechococcales cyanobacterium C42_A2020_086]
MAGFPSLQLRPILTQLRWVRLVAVVGSLLLWLSGCSLPQVKAEDRIFLNLSLDFLGAYPLPEEYAGTRLGGLSGITFDRQRNRLYAVSDDRSRFAPARFYTLKLNLATSQSEQSSQQFDTPLDTPSSTDPISTDPNGAGASVIQSVEVEKVTTLTDPDGNPYPADTLDLEGIALSPRQTLFIASEGVANQGVPPFIDEFELATGRWRQRLPIPTRYRPATVEGQPIGVQDNLGFESLTLSAGSYTNPVEPFRLFAATESALQQDQVDTKDGATPPPTRIRLLHYLVGEELPVLLSEHLYILDPVPETATYHGLSELAVLDQGGHFLSLERSFDRSGFNAKLFQIATGSATDISVFDTFSGDLTGVTPIYKRLLLDLSDLGIPLDNLEGMTLGPLLPDGTQSLVLISDDNFNELQTTELLLFRLRSGAAARPPAPYAP